MVSIEVLVCNVCREVGKPVTSYTVTKQAGATLDVDLCDEHRKPIEALFNPKPAAPARRRDFQARVTTPEEIAASKNARKAPA